MVGNDGEDSEESDAEHLQDVIGRQKHEPPKSDYEKRSIKVRLLQVVFPWMVDL